MREADRHQKLLPVLARELDGDMPAESRRGGPDVDGDIENSPSHDAHQLVLREGRGLEMKAAHGAHGGRQRMIVLDEVEINAGLPEVRPIVRLGDEAAMVSELSRNDDLHPRQGGTLNA
jgi:hypothetical protein